VIASDQLVTVLVNSAVPTLAVVIGILVNNLRFNVLVRTFESGFANTNRHLDNLGDVLRANPSRTQDGIDARLKHLDEYL
jgi:hypothetical protein